MDMALAYFECVDMSPPNSTCQRHVPTSERNRIFGAYFSCVMMIFVVVLGDSGRYKDFSLTLWQNFY